MSALTEVKVGLFQYFVAQLHKCDARKRGKHIQTLKQTDKATGNELGWSGRVLLKTDQSQLHQRSGEVFNNSLRRSKLSCELRPGPGVGG